MGRTRFYSSHRRQASGRDSSWPQRWIINSSYVPGFAIATPS